MTPPLVRPAGPADLEAMCGLLQQLFAIESDFEPQPQRQLRGLALLLETPGAHAFVAEQQGRVIAMATVQTLVSTAEGGPVGLVEDVVVDAGRRGRGIGRALLLHLQRWADQKGLSRLQLLADRDNAPALDFYTKHRWQATGLVALKRSRPLPQSETPGG